MITSQLCKFNTSMPLQYVAKQMIDENVFKNPLAYVNQANIEYKNLKKLAECLMCIPVSTATPNALSVP